MTEKKLMEPEPEVRRDWEDVQRNDHDTTQRLRIAGGWLYRTMSRHAQSITSAMVFVPAAADKK